MAAHDDTTVITKHWSNIVLRIRQYAVVYRRTSSVATSLYHYSVHDLANDPAGRKPEHRTQ